MADHQPAPQRDGIRASRVGVGAGHWANVGDFLHWRFPHAGPWAARLAAGDVLDAGGRPLTADAPCPPGLLIWYWRQPPAEAPIPFELDLLHQDEWLVVVDKPHFLAVTPAGRHLQQTVLVRLQRQLRLPSLAPMHRLDQDTAGVLAFTVQPATRDAYQRLLRERLVHKVYEAVAPWRDDLVLPLTCQHRLEQRPGAAFMQMQVVDGQANAQTELALIRRLPPSGPAASNAGPVELAHYRLTPHTGRKHQLRAQMNALGLPIVGDRNYPTLLPEPAPDTAADHSQPLQLLARELRFTDPVTGALRQFSSRRQLQAVVAAEGAALNPSIG